jgi:hypothetical protein
MRDLVLAISIAQLMGEIGNGEDEPEKKTLARTTFFLPFDGINWLFVS